VRLISMGDDSSPADGTLPVIRETERQALPWLRSVLEMAAAGRIRCSDKTKRPTAASVAALARGLSGGDFYSDIPIASYGWPLLVQAGGLAQLNGTKLELTPRGRGVVTTPTAPTLRGLWRRWLTNGVIDEFSRVECTDRATALMITRDRTSGGNTPPGGRSRTRGRLPRRPAARRLRPDRIVGEARVVGARAGISQGDGLREPRRRGTAPSALAADGPRR
ncbi:MAG TPA: hypothetical protein VES60_01490, partial [Nakamurella sp.]|nr:hypothetical protein [Nakamurella sp.]